MYQNIPNRKNSFISNILHENVKINDKILMQFFYNDLNFIDPKIKENANKIEFGLPTVKKEYMDKNTLYKRNSFGYRSPEFKDAELLIAGCSFTYGSGVPEETSWGSVVASNLNVSYANLGRPGGGVDLIIDTILAYLKKYKKPKILLCLFPDFLRVTWPINQKNNTCTNANNWFDGQNLHFETILHPHINGEISKPSIMKRPYNVHESLSDEIFYYLSIKKILFLEQYCNDVGINFFWSTWDPLLEEMLKKIQNKFNAYNSFVDLQSFGKWKINCFVENEITEYNKNGALFAEKYMLDQTWETFNFFDIPEICHLDLKEKYPNYFYWGGDIEDRTQLGHFGVHRHAHIAEEFLIKIKNIQSDIIK